MTIARLCLLFPTLACNQIVFSLPYTSMQPGTAKRQFIHEDAAPECMPLLHMSRGVLLSNPTKAGVCGRRLCRHRHILSDVLLTAVSSGFSSASPCYVLD